MKNLVLVLFSLLFLQNGSAQTSDINHDFLKNDDAGIGGGIHTGGWNIWFERGHIKDAYKRSFWQIEYTQLHNPKEMRLNIDPGFTLDGYPPKPYMYGKQNSFLLVNGYLGKQNLLGHKSEKSGVEITVKYGAGLTLGLLKPYYLNLIYLVDATNQNYIVKTEKYTGDNQSNFLNQNLIYGGTGFWKGFDELKFIPGATAKASLNFDWASYDDYIKSLEVGVMIQGFYKKVPIMVDEFNYMFYPNLFVNLHFGKRW